MIRTFDAKLNRQMFLIQRQTRHMCFDHHVIMFRMKAYFFFLKTITWWLKKHFEELYIVERFSPRQSLQVAQFEQPNNADIEDMKRKLFVEYRRSINEHRKILITECVNLNNGERHSMVTKNTIWNYNYLLVMQPDDQITYKWGQQNHRYSQLQSVTKKH